MTYAQHARAIARAFQIRLIEDTGLAREEATSFPLERLAQSQKTSCEWRGAVVVHPIEDETDYAIVLHELGHVIAPGGDLTLERGRAKRVVEYVRLQLTEEETAWAWARHHALEWTTAMQQVMDYGMSTYRDGLVAAEQLPPDVDAKLLAELVEPPAAPPQPPAPAQVSRPKPLTVETARQAASIAGRIAARMNGVRA